MLIFATLSLSLAGAPAVPAPLQSFYAEAAADCRRAGGLLSLAPGARAVRRIDLNGDGRQDFILDYSGLRCAGALSIFCGTGGCGYGIAISMPKAYRRERRFGRGLTIGKGRIPTLNFAVHGSECGREGAYDCHQLWRWNGQRLARVRR